MLPQIFHVDIPDALVREVERCKDNAAVRQVGVEWAIAQGRELIAKGIPVIHFYTMGKADNIVRILRELFLANSTDIKRQKTFLHIMNDETIKACARALVGQIIEVRRHLPRPPRTLVSGT